VAQIPGMSVLPGMLVLAVICAAVLPPRWEEEVKCSPCLLDSLDELMRIWLLNALLRECK
jgi:hypothetical protein